MPNDTPDRPASIADAARRFEITEGEVRRDVRRGAPHAKLAGRIMLNLDQYGEWRASPDRAAASVPIAALRGPLSDLVLMLRVARERVGRRHPADADALDEPAAHLSALMSRLGIDEGAGDEGAGDGDDDSQGGQA